MHISDYKNRPPLDPELGLLGAGVSGKLVLVSVPESPWDRAALGEQAHRCPSSPSSGRGYKLVVLESEHASESLGELGETVAGSCPRSPQ